MPAPPHDLLEMVINGKTLAARHILRATVPFNLTGLPVLSMQFAISSDGLPVGVQIVSGWLAKPTVLHVAARLQSVSSVAGLRPDLRYG